MDGAGRVGYEYHVRLRTDDDMISKSHEYILVPGVKNIIIQIRTNFIIIKNCSSSSNNNNDNDNNQASSGDDHEPIDSEQLTIVRLDDEDMSDEHNLFNYTLTRLVDYWMADYEMLRLCKDTLDFGKQVASFVAQPQPSDLIMVPIVVDLDVCTVQLDGETLDATRERAISSKRLVPTYLWPPMFSLEKYTKPPRLMIFLRRLKKIRVVSVEQGLGLMKVCSICSKCPIIGAQISRLDGTCGHAFHSHCVVGFLENDNLCPSCSFPAYDPDYMLDPLSFAFY